MYYKNIKFIGIFIILVLLSIPVYANRISTLPQPGVKTLGNHLTDIDNNFKELYRLIFVGESGFTGLGAGIITSGTLSDSVIPSGITRDTELTTGLATKQNASANLTTFAGITPSANILSLLGAADYPAVRGLLDLEPGIDFLSPAGVTGAITSGIAGKQDTNEHLTDLADGSLTGSKVGTGIIATYITTGTLPDSVIPSTITRDSELTTALSSYTNTSTLTTLLSGKMNTATGTPDGTKFLRDDMTWQIVSAGGGDDWDANNDSLIDIGYLPSSLIIDTELTTALSNYTTSSALTTLLNGKVSIPTGDGSLFYSNDGTYKAVSSDDWDGNNDSVIDIAYLPTALIVDTELTTTLSNYVLTSVLSSYVTASSLTTTLANYIQTGSNASFGTVTATGPITSSGGADGTRGIWFSSPNTITPNTTTYPDGIYLGATSLIGRYAGVDYDLLAAGGSGSVAVDSVVVNNPNFDSAGDIDVSASGSNISSNVKDNVLTLDNLTTGSVITSGETVVENDTSVMTSGAVVKYINDTVNHLVNMKLADADFTIGNYLNPVSSPVTVNNASYTVSGNVYDNGTIPTVEVSLNSGAYSSADMSGTVSPWGWSKLLTLISGSNTVDVRIVNSDLETVQLPQVIVDYSVPDLPTGAFTTPAASGIWVQSATYTLAAGTAQDDQGITSVQWKVGSGTYANASGTTTWSIPSITFSEGANTLYALITGTPTSETTEISTVINVDTINPVAVSGADSTHNGVTPFTGTLVATETNISTVTFTTTNASPASGTCTGTYPNYTTPSITPSGTGNVTITYTVTDLSGRTGSDTQLFTYSGVAYTTTFSDNFNRTNNTNIVTGSSWSSEVDTSSILSITSNELICLASSGTDARAVKTLSTNNTDWQIEFKFKINDVTAVHSGAANTYFLNTYCNAGPYVLIALKTDASGNISQIVIGRYNDVGTVSYQYINYTFAADTYYTMTIQGDIGAPATADGVFTVKMNSSDIYTVSNLADETRPIITEIRFGMNTYVWSQATTWSYDDFTFGYK